MIASDVMTPEPVTVTPDTTVAEVWDLMREHVIRHVPVIEEGALVGVLSDRDLGYLDIGRILATEGAEALQRELQAPVAKLMTSSVLHVDSDTALSDVIALMLEGRVGAIPVVRPGTREIEGIVSYIDVLRVARQMLEEE
jgi:acetoin utilization protein AcuB